MFGHCLQFELNVNCFVYFKINGSAQHDINHSKKALSMFEYFKLKKN